ncbi:ATP-binding protein [Bacillus paranthracis]|uniref:DnaC-like helicase loader n=1 Tax=Bacillus phage phi4B1 TaxID=1643324 RepID=UPI000200F412|nr:ATP-binding protein [Bacillus paranthracis]YP_009206344.1 DnaC-like helicase loader [Bacillus phage phi4B1]ADY20338.1 DNA replication protein-like protein [Bacillus thuringiensis serovar finitimus YBT-020]OTX71282.1 DNA replication protein [Bacillus thuringiensis serovar finitimus]PGZ45721.1 DNA replication protein [Bacillus anthracis]ALF02550.1 IstB-like ATP binding domain protein [Bacillus phage phi4B1]MCR6799383.1 ATP-binding protein [Bacillus paranthracis]
MRKKKLEEELNQPIIEDSQKQSVECEKCNDRGYIFEKQPSEFFKGKLVDVAIECECLERKSLMARFKNAMIPTEFENARFDNYIRETEVQKTLYNSMIEYLKIFNDIRESKMNSIGFIAEVGESKLKALPPGERNAMRKEYNSYGLGKTHLQIAAAKYALNHFKVVDKHTGRLRGIRVLCVQDVNIIAEIQSAAFLNDNKKRLNELLHDLCTCDILVWDDLAKSRHSEFKEDMYYKIINDRYSRNLPIWYTSNEDLDTLEDKIGFAAADRLFGMSKDYLYQVKGLSFRTDYK